MGGGGHALGTPLADGAAIAAAGDAGVVAPTLPITLDALVALVVALHTHAQDEHGPAASHDVTTEPPPVPHLRLTVVAVPLCVRSVAHQG